MTIHRCTKAFGAGLLASALLLGSCSASISSAIRADGGARISIQAEVPPALAAKFRKLAAAGTAPGGSGAAPGGSFFDTAAIRKSIAAKPGLSIVDLGQGNPDSVRAELSVRSLEELAASPDLKNSGLIAVSRGPGWKECRLRLARGGAKTLTTFFPGIDPHLMEALSPPALEEDPVTLAEYRTMLKSILGEKAMAAMEAATLRLSLSAPGPVMDSGGGSLAGTTLSAKIPVIEALALEKPIELWLRWRNEG